MCRCIGVIYQGDLPLFSFCYTTLDRTPPDPAFPRMREWMSTFRNTSRPLFVRSSEKVSTVDHWFLDWSASSSALPSTRQSHDRADSPEQSGNAEASIPRDSTGRTSDNPRFASPKRLSLIGLVSQLLSRTSDLPGLYLFPIGSLDPLRADLNARTAPEQLFSPISYSQVSFRDFVLTV